MSASPRLSEGQFTLLTLLLVQAACGVATMAVLWVGPAVVLQWAIAISVLACAAILLGLCSRFSPRLAVNVAVFGLMGLMLLSLVPCWLVRSREETRGISSLNGMRYFAHDVHALHYYQTAEPYLDARISEQELPPQRIDLANKFVLPLRHDRDALNWVMPDPPLPAPE